MADVATIALLQHRAAIQAHLLVDQLNHALIREGFARRSGSGEECIPAATGTEIAARALSLTTWASSEAVGELVTMAEGRRPPPGLEISQRPQDLIPVHGNGATGVATQTPLIFVTPIWQSPQYPVDRSGNGLFLARAPCGVLAPTRGRLHCGQCGNSVMRWAYDFP